MTNLPTGKPCSSKLIISTFADHPGFVGSFLPAHGENHRFNQNVIYGNFTKLLTEIIEDQMQITSSVRLFTLHGRAD